MQKLTTVHLHGILADEFGDRHEYQLSTPRDIVAAIQANQPTFKRRILELEQQGFGYRLISGNNFDGSADLDEFALVAINQSSELHLMPVIKGSGAIGRIITGAVLIGGGFLLGGFGGGLLAKGLIGVGAAIALGGVNRLFAPRPPAREEQNKFNNTIFGAGDGVSDFAYAIPFVYGLAKIESPAILSSSSKAIRVGGTDLQNDTYFSLIAAISEGEIVGLANTANPANSVLIGDTPLVGGISNPNSTEPNFGSVALLTRLGTSGQTPLNIMSNALLDETDVNVELLDLVGVTRTISGDYYGFWLKVTISTLYYNNGQGGIEGNVISFWVDVQTDGGYFVRIASFEVGGKTTQPFQQTFEFSLPPSVSKSWNIKLTSFRPFGDYPIRSNGTERRAIASWSTITTLAPKTTNYPNIALLGLELNAKFLGSSPGLSAIVRGIKVGIPHNYNPTDRTYTGAFNGTLAGAKQWTNNPAWILYDLIVNNRYGIGLSPTQVDIYSFYAAGVYCDELVPNGSGGLQPRFTFNSGIYERVDGQELLRRIAGAFNAFLVWSNGKIAIAQDRPSAPVWAFTQANVVVEVDDNGIESAPFEYSQVDFGSRFSAANVSYVDSSTWQSDIESFTDNSLVTTFGYKPAEITAVGCTNRGQAARIGRWEVFNSAYCDELITFRSARDMLPIEIGDVVEVFDKYEQGQKFAGRITEVISPTQIRLDQPFSLGTVSYDVTILYPDGGQQTRDVLSATGDVLAIATAFDTLPTAGHLYALRRTDISPTLWRIIAIAEDDDEIFQVQGVKYTDTKWAYVDSGELLPERRTTLLNANPEPPTNLNVTTNVSLTPSATGLRILATWQWTPPTTGSPIVGYQIEYQKAGNQNPATAIANGASYEAEIEQGEYTFRIRSVSPIGILSPWATLNFTVDFTKDIPTDVANFGIAPQSKEFILATWDESPDIDVRLAGKLRIRFSASSSGWDNALLLDEFPGNSRSGQLPLRDGTYYAKWVDPYGNESEIAASLTTQNLGLLSRNIIATIAEDPSFSGAKTNCYVNSDGLLTIEPVLNWDDETGLWDDNTGLWDDNTGGAFEPNAIYEFANSLTVSDVQDVSLVADYAAVSSSLLTLWDDAPELWDDRTGLFDGELTGNARIRLQVRTSEDGSTYGDWQDFTVGTFRLLTAQFRALLEAVGEENIFVSDLQAIADVADRMEVGTVVTSASADTVVAFSRPYVVAPPNGITYSVQSGTMGDETTISSVTKNGFTINVRNGGARISRTVRWLTESY